MPTISTTEPTTNRLAGGAEQCPAWCSGIPAEHPDDEGVTTHSRVVGDLGVEVVECLPDEPAYLLLPDRRTATVAEARRLAADLLAAAAILDGAA